MNADRAVLTSTLLFLAAGPIPAQQQMGPATPEIRGVVIEPGVEQPVPEAEVSYWKMPENGVITGKTFTPDNVLGTMKTGPDGAFRFTPERFGRYYLSAKKEGYGNAEPSTKGVTTSATFSLTSDRPVRELRLLLARPAQITGALADEDTGRPVANYQVSARQDHYNRGRRMGMPGGFGLTDEEGRFVLKVTPGDYLVRLRSGSIDAARLMRDFSENDLKTVDLDYEQSYWTGGHDEDSAAPIHVGSGDTLDVGLLKARKAPFYRVHLSLPEASCGPKDTVFVTLAQVPPKTIWSDGPVPCPKGVLMAGLAPGAYQMAITLVGGRSTEEIESGWVAFQVTDKNLDIPVSPARGVDVAGKVVVSEGAVKPPVDKMRISMEPVVAARFASGNLGGGPDAQGNFRFVNLPLTEQRLSVTGVPGGYCIKEVRYNGRAVRGNLSALSLTLDGQATSHSLEIELDDKPAFLTGTVRERDRPVGQPYVVLMPWPLHNPADLWPIPSMTGNDDGKFQFAGLAPGEYRILAVDSAAKDELNKPNILERLLATATKIELGPRATQNLTLELTNLR